MKKIFWYLLVLLVIGGVAFFLAKITNATVISVNVMSTSTDPITYVKDDGGEVLRFAPMSQADEINVTRDAPSLTFRGYYWDSVNGVSQASDIHTGAFIDSAGSMSWAVMDSDINPVFLVNDSGFVGVNTTTRVGSEVLNVGGNVRAVGYQSADGSAGMTGTCDLTSASSLEIKNGLIISCN